MRLFSTAFTAHAWIPRRFTCEGENVSPPLAWSDAPVGTRSFALVCADPDAPGGVWYHWAIFDIPPGAHGLAEDQPAVAAGMHQAMNDFRHIGYGGPCPPRGDAPHHYRFRLYAVNRAPLGIGPGMSCRRVEAEAEEHAIATADLTGLFGRT